MKQTHRLNLHDTYGVNWTAEMIVRDLMQNFYDSVPKEEFLQKIILKTDAKRGLIRISGPQVFDIELLWRIGVGTKANDNNGRYAGGFGEGFAVAILQLLRDKLVTDVSMRVGGQKITFKYDDVAVSTLKVRELICEVEKISPIKGAELILENATEDLARIFKSSRDYFDHPEHPLFGEKLSDDVVAIDPKEWGGYCRHPSCPRCMSDVDYMRKRARRKTATQVEIYRSTSKKGAVFYKRQLRAELDVPLIICCKATLGRVGLGRDRMDLTPVEVKAVLRYSLITLNPNVIKNLVLKEFRQYWTRGHVILEQLGKVYSPHGNGTGDIKFPPEYCATYGGHEDKIEARRHGAHPCPYYMTLFGMQSTSVFRVRDDQVEKRMPQMFALSRQGDFTVKVDEVTGYQILRDAYKKVFLSGNFRKRPPTSRSVIREFTDYRDRRIDGWKFLVFDQIKDHPDTGGLHGEKTLSMCSKHFRSPFGMAFSVFVHEASHKFGFDGSYNFGKALKHALQEIVAHSGQLDEFEERWSRNLKKGSDFPSTLQGFSDFTNHYTGIHVFDELTARFVYEATKRALATILNWKVDVLPFTQGTLPGNLSSGERKFAARLFYLYGEMLDSHYIKERAQNVKEIIVEAHRTALIFDPKLNEAIGSLYVYYTFDKNDFDAAHELIQEALRLQPNNAALIAYMGELKHEVGIYEECVEWYMKAIKLKPLNTGYHEKAARELFQLGQWQRGYNLLLPFVAGKRPRQCLKSASGKKWPGERLVRSSGFTVWARQLASELEADFQITRDYDKQSPHLLAKHFVFYHIIELFESDAFLEIGCIANALMEQQGKKTAAAFLTAAIHDFSRNFDGGWYFVDTFIEAMRTYLK